MWPQLQNQANGQLLEELRNRVCLGIAHYQGEADSALTSAGFWGGCSGCCVLSWRLSRAYKTEMYDLNHIQALQTVELC